MVVFSCRRRLRTYYTVGGFWRSCPRRPFSCSKLTRGECCNRPFGYDYRPHRLHTKSRRKPKLYLSELLSLLFPQLPKIGEHQQEREADDKEQFDPRQLRRRVLRPLRRRRPLRRVLRPLRRRVWFCWSGRHMSFAVVVRHCSNRRMLRQRDDAWPTMPVAARTLDVTQRHAN